MRELTEGQNIDDPNIDYPYGRSRNETPAKEGTIFSEEILGDLLIAFQRLANLETLGEKVIINNLPDNQTNGYQIIESMYRNMLPTWQPNSNGINFKEVKFCMLDNALYFHKTIINTDTLPQNDTTNWQLVFKRRTDGLGFEFNEYKTLWAELTKLQAGVITSDSYIQARQKGDVVTVNMSVKLTSTPTQQAMFSLPSSISKPSGTTNSSGVPFSVSSDSNGATRFRLNEDGDILFLDYTNVDLLNKFWYASFTYIV